MSALFPAEHLAACFSPHYAQAQDRFRKAALAYLEDSQYQEVVQSDYQGPQGEKLALAWNWRGPSDASHVLVTQSATHGVEGFAGSAIQVDHLLTTGGQILPADVAILHIHAVNPWGFAWLRRVNEEGVDLNRNFVDFTSSLPKNALYSQVADVIVPRSLEELAASEQEIYQVSEHMGRAEFEAALTEGQYTHPNGLFYGGTKPSWSRTQVEGLIDRLDLKRRKRLAVVDIHTGLGPYGYGEIICDHAPDSEGAILARRWYGDSVTEPALGTSSSPPKHGLIDYGWQRMLGDRVCFVTLEFGTYPLLELFTALRQDHVIHRETIEWNNPVVQKVKARIRRQFYPDKRDWQEMILFRGRQVLAQAIDGLLGAV